MRNLKGPMVHPDYMADKEARKVMMRKIMIIINILYDFFKDEEKVIMWLDAGNLNFGGAKPIDLINEGRINKVLLWCQAAKAQNVPPSITTH